MTTRSAFALALLVLQAGCASAGASPGASTDGGEILLGWSEERLSGDPAVRGRATLDWSTTPGIPADAESALLALRAAVRARSKDREVVLTSPGGRAVALMHVDPWHWNIDPSPPRGVVIWPDWRDASTVIEFADMGKAQFLSDHHVRLTHRSKDGSDRSGIVDLRRPTVSFQVDGVRRNTLRVCNSGRWAGIASDGSIRHGRFDANDPAGSAVGAVIQGAGEPRNLLWIDDGRRLVVDRDGSRLEVIDAADGTVRATRPGSLSPPWVEPIAVGQRRFDAVIPGTGSVLVEVRDDGSLATARLDFQSADEYILMPSPSGRLAVTQDSHSKFSSTPRQIRSLSVPVWGDAPPDWRRAPSVDGIQEVGWLAWP